MARATPRPTWPMLLLSSAISASLLGMAQPLRAEVASQAVSQRFDIPAQDLASALLAFSRQSGIDVIFDGSLPSGLRSQPVSGSYSSVQALGLLLQGSGLHFEAAGEHSLRLVRPADGAGALELGVTDISGFRNPAFDSYATPGPSYSVSREQLDRVTYSRPGDIFDSVPGVAAASSSNGAGLQLNIRGMQGMGRVKTMIDGTIQNVSTYKGYSGNREDTYVDPDLIGGIDIKKGPDAGPQGAGVVGGIVNMRTINASDIITDPEKNWGLRIKGMYGNNVAHDEHMENSAMLNGYRHYYTLNRKSGKNGTISRCNGTNTCTSLVPLAEGTSIGGPLPDKNWSGSLAASWRPLDNWEVTAAHAVRQSGNYFSGSRGKNSWKGLRPDLADTEVYNTSLNSETWLLKNKLSFLDDHSLELGYIKYRNQSGYFNSLATGFEGHFQDRLFEAESHTYTANYAWQPDTPWFDVRANLWKSRLDSELSFDLRGYFTNLTDPQDSDISSDTLGYELWNTSTIDLPLGELSLKYGLSYAREKADGSVDVQSALDERIGTALAKGTRTTHGSFLQSQWQATSWLTLNAALQHTRAKLEDGNGLTGDNRLSATDPSYGIVLQPHRAVQLFAQWSKGSRAPTVREAYLTSYATSVMANPDLKMEKADNFEYGLNLLFDSLISNGDQLGLKFSRFENTYDDYIVRLHRRAMGENTSGSYSYKFANIDKAEYKGYEISADYDTGWAFASFTLTHYDKVKYCYPGYTGNGSASNPYQPTPVACYAQPNSNDYGGNYVPPRQEKTAGLGVRLFERKLTLGGRMKMSTASMYGGSFRGQYTGTTVWDNYEIYDLYGSLQATKNLELGFSVENLTDRFYIPSYTAVLEALPAPGRTVRGTVTLSF